MAKSKGKSDEQIVSLLERHLKSNMAWGGAKLSKEREDALDYYHGLKPLPMHGGDSKFVSQDVFDAIEGAKSMLLEAFSAGRRPVEFTPNKKEDVAQARSQTAYVSHVLFVQNPGHRILETTIMDGLLARTGVVKSWWKEEKEEVEEEFGGISEDEFAMLLSDPEAEIDEKSLQIAPGPTGLVLAGRLKRVIDKSHICVENIAPEDFFIDEDAKSVKHARCTGDRSRKTKDELIALGADEMDLDKVTFKVMPDHNDGERQARSQLINDEDGHGTAETAEVQDMYIRADLDGSGMDRLWNIVRCGSLVLRKERVKYCPYNTFTPLPIPHQFYGSSFAKKIMPIQNAATSLIRSVINHTLITNNPRWGVVKGALRTPRELMENRIGGIVNLDRPDGVFPLPQAQMNPFVFEVMKLMDQKKEDVSGVSRLSQGINKDAISKQNSAGMIEQLTSLSMQRTKIVARQFGEFVKELFFNISRLVLDYEDRQKIVNVAGEWVEIDPAAWVDFQQCSLDLTLGYGEQDKEFEKRMMIYQLLANDPKLEPMFTPVERYNLLKSAFEKIGLVDYGSYIKNPEQIPPQEPSKMEQLQVAMVEAQVNAQTTSTQIAQFKAEADAKFEQMRLDLEKAKAQATHAIASDKMDLEEAKLAQKVVIDTAEIAAMETADQVTGVASPNG